MTTKKTDGAPGDKAPQAFEISSRAEGFRRAGRAWSKAPQTVLADELSAEQLAALQSEPMLVVVPVFAAE
jgi:hypothetical protein